MTCLGCAVPPLLISFALFFLLICPPLVRRHCARCACPARRVASSGCERVACCRVCVLPLSVCAGRKNSFFSFLVGVRAAAQRRPCLPLFKRPRLPCGGEHGPVFRATARRMYATADL